MVDLFSDMPQALQNTIEISSKKLFYNDQITLTGVIGFPTLNLANQTKQFNFVNGRKNHNP